MQHPSPLLSECAGLAHGFFTRRGGVSDGLYASLNCGPGSQDAPQHVAENRRRVAEALGAKELLTLHQVHSADVIVIDARRSIQTKPEADALVTNQRGIALGILAADCGPVLMADPDAGVIGAAHAGWKGALGGVLEHTVAAMETLGASRTRIRAALGPCIQPHSYQVDAGFYERFVDASPDYRRFFSADAPARRFDPFPTDSAPMMTHYYFDLPGFILHRLQQCGITHTESLGMDTYSNEGEFYSYRRATHRDEADYGRQISVVMMK